ncbi:hypothetical protein TRP8649_01441 [Pelagimonas phthalicica]|uniref:UPF0311 protein TRP8649_01441 n=1 Tax=Pelagimonas phthalicica TaxID=1037362 RepID=A0A238JB14_9RHOB|nr:DUF3237 domain-containing protein [Pelagimonas phthalicica]TDS94137.1 uncharacterized protein DUF3237 [Pelagimonas phthalicica]SMX27337.1 hypothetical protein TRP8649_01441 [Pelagimonas phthalicica]
MQIPVPALSHAFTLRVELAAPIELGPGRAGQRRIIPIVGGAALGPDITGEVMNLGADWQTIFADGAAHLDTRYAVKTDDGAVIEIVNIGTRHGPPEVLARLAAGEEVDPSTYYMRTAARLETGDARYDWVNHTLFVCAGIRRASAVEIAYYKVD